MAFIDIEVPDNKLQLVVDAVNSHVNPDLTPEEVKIYVQCRLENELSAFVRDYQMAMYLELFEFDDPVVRVVEISPEAADVFSHTIFLG